MRHARAESTAASDQQRSLTDAGHAEARATGVWLAEEDVTPERALVSAAVRTRETWTDAAQAAGWEPDLATYDEGLYTAGPETVLDLIGTVEDEVDTLLVLGHNPTVALLAQHLDDGEGDPEATTALLRGFPPGSAVVLEVAGSWADLDDVGGRVVAFR